MNKDIYKRILPYAVERLAFGDEDLAFGGGDENVRLHVAECRFDKLVEAVVDGQDDDQGSRPYSHTDGTDRGDDVDHVV